MLLAYCVAASLFARDKPVLVIRQAWRWSADQSPASERRSSPHGPAIAHGVRTEAGSGLIDRDYRKPTCPCLQNVGLTVAGGVFNDAVVSR